MLINSVRGEAIVWPLPPNFSLNVSSWAQEGEGLHARGPMDLRELTTYKYVFAKSTPLAHTAWPADRTMAGALQRAPAPNPKLSLHG